MTKAIISLLGFLVFLYSSVSLAGVPQVFLVQNSGWMQPYFVDSKAQFPEIMQRLVQMSCGASQVPATLAVFNQSPNPKLSPQELYQGGCNAMPVRQLAGSIRAAHLPGNATVFANSDYQQALYRAIESYANGRSAIFWMVTNNKNSPNNSHQLSAHDAAFYHLLHGSPQISRVIALPLADPAASPNFASHGLIVFGIAYGQAAAKELADLVSNGLVRHYFGVRAASLKPLNISAVRFVPLRVTGAATKVESRNGELVIRLPARNHAQKFTLEGRFVNQFYPYTINQASSQTELFINGKTYAVSLTPDRISNLEPEMGSAPVSLSLTVPATPTWSLSTIFGNGRDISALLRFSLTQQKLAISPEFVKVMDGILPNAPMPAIFRPDPNIHSSKTEIPLLIQVQYPIWPLLILLAGLVAVLIMIGFVLFQIMNRGMASVRVRINGRVTSYRLARGKVQKLKNEDGDVVGEVSRGMFGYRLSGVKKGVKIEIVKK